MNTVYSNSPKNTNRIMTTANTDKFTSRRLGADERPDLVILHNGGGTQSGTLIEMIHDGLIERPDAVIQADTGDEPVYIYKQWARDKKLMQAVGIPYIVVRNGNMAEDLYGNERFAALPVFTVNKNGHNRRGKKQPLKGNQITAFDVEEFSKPVPNSISGFGVTTQFNHKGKLQRQCTSEYKIVPIERELRTMLLEMRLANEYKNGAIHVKKGVLIESWFGYTVEEIERVNQSGNHWQYIRYPLIEMRMTKADCVAWLADNDKPPRLGSFCKKCPLIGNSQMRELRDNDPKGYEEGRLQFDDDLRNGNLRIAATARADIYLHSSLIPMRDVNIDDDSNQPAFLCRNTGCMT